MGSAAFGTSYSVTRLQRQTLRRALPWRLMVASSLVACAHARTSDPATAPAEWSTSNRPVSVVHREGSTFILFSDDDGESTPLTPGGGFRDGDIDVDLRGRDELQKSFVGVVFRMTNDSTYETAWLRPFNYGVGDSTRRVHAVQYASYPTHSWERLRTEQPGAYEAAVVPPPKPTDWVHLRVEVRGPAVRVYVNGAKMLDVRTPADRGRGSAGVWIGDQTQGEFMNVRIKPLR